ncbi:unnamed protein product [Acanthocheilonema viteae]|uniref:Uncharacterized protein n=1 Tax=Acanthocheilonema viteae TaxID=6277 RepID=A0A498S6T5_ACAVI|nr:unnamed protein product [Acanthocheilonema viteae]
MANRDWELLKFNFLTKLITALELDEDLLISEQELLPLNELRCSDEEASSSSAFSIATTTNSGPSIVTSTNVSTEGMSSAELIPCLSVGPYHQRPTPILTDNPFVGTILASCLQKKAEKEGSKQTDCRRKVDNVEERRSKSSPPTPIELDGMNDSNANGGLFRCSTILLNAVWVSQLIRSGQVRARS